MRNGIPFVHRQPGLFENLPQGQRAQDHRFDDEEEIEDRDFAHAIRDRLMDEPILDASRVQVIVKNEEIILRGTVPSYGDRDRAEQLANHLGEGLALHNELRVQRSLF
jgi:osmotically-inducible protein OsmY